MKLSPVTLIWDNEQKLAEVSIPVMVTYAVFWLFLPINGKRSENKVHKKTETAFSVFTLYKLGAVQARMCSTNQERHQYERGCAVKSVQSALAPSSYLWTRFPA